MEEKYGAIDTDDSLRHCYYIIKFSSSTYTLQEDFSIDGQFISSGKMLCKGNYFFPISINSHYYVKKEPNPLTHIFFKDNNK